MNKKEVLEIRKQFTPDNCAITRICGCYVDHEKNIILESKDAFLSLPEEEEFKYFEIFRHTLSGTLGKNLVGMEFPLEQEEAGGTQEFLLKLRDTRLEDDALVQEFYEKIIENYDYGENYYIILIHSVYDIPGKSTAGDEMFDASDEVYAHIMCSICPVKMSRAGLSYNAVTNSIADRVRDWVVEQPVNGFLFPAFNDRSSDIHSVLTYAKNPEIEQPGLIETVLGSVMPLTPATQKETFQSILSETLEEDGDYEVVKSIHENLSEMIEENKDNPEPLTLSKTEVKKLLENSGVPEKNMETFEQVFAEKAGDKTELLATNITNTKRFDIETPDIVIKVNPERTDLIETKLIDGRQCLVIAVDDHVEVNGISVRTVPKRTITDPNMDEEEELL